MPEWLMGEKSSWFWSMLQFVGLVGSLGFIYRQLKAQVAGNMMQSLHAMADKWDSDHMLAFRNAACANYQREDLDISGVDGEALAFFEDIGLYCRKNVFTIDVVWERYSYYIEHYWAMYRERIMRLRESTNDPSWFSNFEYVQSKAAKYGKRRYGVSANKTIGALAQFAESELRTAAIHRGMSRDEGAVAAAKPVPSSAALPLDSIEILDTSSVPLSPSLSSPQPVESDTK